VRPQDDIPGVSENAQSIDRSGITHNHPRGSSLSEQDLRFAIRSDLSQIRAVTATHRFWIDRPKEGWASVAPDELAANIAATRAMLRSRLRQEVIRGVRTVADAEANLHHLLWTNLSVQGIIAYGYRPWAT
jgi:hypothetical protein